MFLSSPVLCSYTLFGLVVLLESEKDGYECSNCDPLYHCMVSFLFGDNHSVIDKHVTVHPLSWCFSLLTVWHVVLEYKSNILSFFPFYQWHYNNAIITKKISSLEFLPSSEILMGALWCCRLGGYSLQDVFACGSDATTPRRATVLPLQSRVVQIILSRRSWAVCFTTAHVAIVS
jgi:hypothetical protein